MNSYKITCTGALMGRTEVEAANIHTAVKKLLYPHVPNRKPASINKGETIWMVIERIA